jgi:hypothetical protein
VVEIAKAVASALVWLCWRSTYTDHAKWIAAMPKT